jgi:hypothetical protein
MRRCPKPRSASWRARTEQFESFRFGQGAQLKDLRPGDQRGVDEKKRVVGGRTHQTDHAALHIRKQDILLRFVEPVNLVDEDQGGLPGVLEPMRRRTQHSPHVRDIGFHAAQLLKSVLGLERNNLSQRGLTRPGRTVEDERLDAVRLNRAPQQLTGT